MDKTIRIVELAHELSEELRNGSPKSIIEELEASHPGIYNVILQYAMMKSLVMDIPYELIEVDMVVAAILVLRLDKESSVEKLEPSAN